MLNLAQLTFVRLRLGWVLSSAIPEAFVPASEFGPGFQVGNINYGAGPGNSSAIENDSHPEILQPPSSGH